MAKNRNGPKKMAKLTKNSSGSWMKISASCGQRVGREDLAQPVERVEERALTPAKANSSWHSASSPKMISA